MSRARTFLLMYRLLRGHLPMHQALFQAWKTTVQRPPF